MRRLAMALFLCWVGATALLTDTEAAPSITTCAIRWDAWYTNGPTDPAHYTALALSRPEFHALAPLHAKFDSSGQITWAPTQDTFDAEIRAAHKANLCWAYLMYGKDNVIDLNNSMMRGLQFHRASKIKDLTQYAMITQSGLLGRAEKYQAAVDATVKLMKDTNYERIDEGERSRPLLFLYYDPNDLKTFFKSDLSSMKAALDSLREKSAAVGLGNPYIVLVFSGAVEAERLRSGLGANAVTQYIAGRRKTGSETWAEFEPTIISDWNDYLQITKADVVPTLRSGADIRARCVTPPPFEHRFLIGGTCNNYAVVPTYSEINVEFEQAVDWVHQNAVRDPLSILLVYAWSECDESGNCLMPTIGDPSGKILDAISKTTK